MVSKKNMGGVKMLVGVSGEKRERKRLTLLGNSSMSGELGDLAQTSHHGIVVVMIQGDFLEINCRNDKKSS